MHILHILSLMILSVLSVGNCLTLARVGIIMISLNHGNIYWTYTVFKQDPILKEAPKNKGHIQEK